MEDLANGRWSLESRDENFDKFLECRSARWFLRSIMLKISADVEFELSDDKKVFTKKTFTSIRNAVYPMPVDQDFVPEKTLSGRNEVGRIFETSGRKVIQEMRYENEDKPIATIERHVIDDKMYVNLKCKDISSKEVYTRIKKN